MAFEKDPNEIGCLWEKSSAKGQYFTGTINGEPVVVFAVKSTNPKAPNWRVLKAKPKDGDSPRPAHNANAAKKTDDLDW